MRISRRAVAIAGRALLVAIGAIGVALLTLDLNQFVNPVLARLKAATGARDHRGRQCGFAHRTQAADRR
jgi:hypothetical protein